MKYVLYAIEKETDEEKAPFIIKEIDHFLEDQISQTFEESLEVSEKSELPSILQWTKTIAFILSLILIAGTLRSFGEGVTINQAYENAAIIFWIMPFPILGWLGLLIYEKIKFKQVESSGAMEETLKRIDTVSNMAFEQLGIPEDSIGMDVIGFTYKCKNDEIKIVDKGLVHGMLFERNVYIEDKHLCFGDMERVQAIPLTSFQSVEEVKKNMMVINWNKDVPPNKPPYKQYKVKTNSMGMFIIKPYYIVSIRHMDDTYLLYLPNYEIDTFLELTGMSIMK